MTKFEITKIKNVLLFFTAPQEKNLYFLEQKIKGIAKKI
jgi:hypothetical protein